LAEQTYQTHRHNPKLTALGYLFLLVAAVAFGLRWFDIGGRAAFGAGLAALMASQLVMLKISRSYTTALQDRIIKLEMKIRCAQLLSPAGHTAAGRLSNAQIVALRFASDEELPALLERADREHLNPDQIKRAIKKWVADWDRT
jgi:predicted phage-related endonuclease